MKNMIYAGSIDGSAPVIRNWPVNVSQTIVKDSVLVVATGKASVAAAEAAAGTVLGVARTAVTTTTSVDADDIVEVDINPNSLYRMGWYGTSKTSLDREDVGTLFDLSASDAYNVALDDTSNGYFEYYGDGDGTIESGSTMAVFLIKHRYQNV